MKSAKSRKSKKVKSNKLLFIILALLFLIALPLVVIFSNSSSELKNIFAATNTSVFSGSLNRKQPSRSHSLSVPASGTLSLSLSYSKLSSATVKVFNSAGVVVAQGTGATPVKVTTTVTTGIYSFQVSGTGSGSYTLNVTYPIPDPTPVPDTAAPSVPTNLSATSVSTSQIDLSWTQSTDNTRVTAYDVYRNNTLLTTVVTNSYSDLSLTPSTTYSYFVKAKDSAGNNSPQSATVTATTKTPPDTTLPTVTITSPIEGAILTNTVNIIGTAGDNTTLSKVEVQIDSNGYIQATGTTNWTYSLNSTLYPNTTHTITARATDTAGNQQISTRTITINNNTSSTTPPDTQGTWISPEGVTIIVSSAGTDPETGQLWTIANTYRRLKENAIELEKVGPHLTIKLQDDYNTICTSSASSSGGVYTWFGATITLNGKGSNFSISPDRGTAHEYGHAWSMYHLYLTHQANWSSFLNKRWTNSDGNVVLATDSRLNSSYSWNQSEIIADDYRLLFGSPLAISQAPNHMNIAILHPNQQPGLKDWFLTVWAGQ